MQSYLKTVEHVYLNGKLYPDRTGVGRIRIFGGSETYDLSLGFPVVTTRKLYLKSMVKELLGFIKGSNSVSDLGESFWGAWSPCIEDVEEEIERIKTEATASGASENIKMFNDPRHIESIRKYLSSKIGTIGPMYGVMWRKFPRINSYVPEWFKSFDDFPSDRKEEIQTEFMKQVLLSQGQLENNQKNWENFAVSEYFKTYDQLNMVYLNLKRKPFSSHHRVTALHPDTSGDESLTPKQNVMAGQAALNACHSFFQFMVTEEIKNQETKKVLNCMFYMSSSDVMLGRPYNIAQYALLTMLMSHCLDYVPGKLTIVSCDTHIYKNHMGAAEEQLTRDPMPLCQVKFPEDKKDLFGFSIEDIEFVNYTSHSSLPLKPAV